MTREWRNVFALVAVLCLPATQGGAVTLGQLDDFENGTTENWFVGNPHPAPPQNISGGGPAGVDDNYMLLTALGGNGPGSRLTVINATQWAGDYASSGIGRLAMDLQNPSNNDLNIRLLFENPVFAPPTDVAITTDVFLPAGSGWTHVEFSVLPSDLIVLLGDLNHLLSNTTEIRIFHNPDPEYPPPPILAQLGIDNIEALGGTTPAEAASWGRVKGLFR